MSQVLKIDKPADIVAYASALAAVINGERERVQSMVKLPVIVAGNLQRTPGVTADEADEVAGQTRKALEALTDGLDAVTTAAGRLDAAADRVAALMRRRTGPVEVNGYRID